MAHQSPDRRASAAPRADPEPFYLGTYHVTRGQFRQFVADTGTRRTRRRTERVGSAGCPGRVRAKRNSWRNAGFEQTDEHPVVNVSWNDAVAFCKWLSSKEGKTYRLAHGGRVGIRLPCRDDNVLALWGKRCHAARNVRGSLRMLLARRTRRGN